MWRRRARCIARWTRTFADRTRLVITHRAGDIEGTDACWQLRGRQTSPGASGGLSMTWRIALIDSCGEWPGACDAAAFVSDGERVEMRATAADRSGHGSRIARLFAASGAAYELMLGQVFFACGAGQQRGSGGGHRLGGCGAGGSHSPESGARGRPGGAGGRGGARGGRGLHRRCAMPARGAAVYPAAYPGVIRATGDARCAPGEVSCLGPWLFGGCARFEVGAPTDAGGGKGEEARRRAGRAIGGASVGAAWVTRTLLSGPKCATASAAVSALGAGARYFGAERRGAVPVE